MSRTFPFLTVTMSFISPSIIPCTSFVPFVLPSIRVPEGRPRTPPGNTLCLCLMNDRRKGGRERERERESCAGDGAPNADTFLCSIRYYAHRCESSRALKREVRDLPFQLLLCYAVSSSSVARTCWRELLNRPVRVSGCWLQPRMCAHRRGRSVASQTDGGTETWYRDIGSGRRIFGLGSLSKTPSGWLNQSRLPRPSLEPFALLSPKVWAREWNVERYAGIFYGMHRGEVAHAARRLRARCLPV